LLPGHRNHSVTLYCSMRLCRTGCGVSVTAPPALYLAEHALKVAGVAATPMNWDFDVNVRDALVKLRTRMAPALFATGAEMLDTAECNRRLMHEPMPDAAALSSLPSGVTLQPPTGDFPAVTGVSFCRSLSPPRRYPHKVHLLRCHSMHCSVASMSHRRNRSPCPNPLCPFVSAPPRPSPTLAPPLQFSQL